MIGYEIASGITEMTVALAGYDFADNKASIICRHCMDGVPVLAFFHDDDGDIHFSCGADGHSEADWMVVDIEDVVERNRDLLSLPTVRMGEVAERSAEHQAWVVSKE